MEPGTQSEEVARRLRGSITRLVRTLRRNDSDDDLTPTLASSLYTITSQGPLSVGELSRREHMTKPSTTAVVEKLCRMGLIERRSDPDDGRVVHITVTTDGRHRIDRRRAGRTAWLTDRVERLDPHERDALSRAAEIIDQLIEADGEDPA
jgi:DNA-binding MarR family transcriptional regulator